MAQESSEVTNNPDRAASHPGAGEGRIRLAQYLLDAGPAIRSWGAVGAILGGGLGTTALMVVGRSAIDSVQAGAAVGASIGGRRGRLLRTLDCGVATTRKDPGPRPPTDRVRSIATLRRSPISTSVTILGFEYRRVMANNAGTPTKILLDESEMPTQWYNIIPDLPEPPPPPLHPGTREPVGPDDLAPLFPMALIMQEVSTDSYIDIPRRFRTSTSCGGPRR